MDASIVNQTHALLCRMLPEECYALDFTQEHYDVLIEALSEQFGPDKVGQNRGAVKKGITEFFADTLQDVKTSIVNGEFRITKQFVYPSQGETFDRLVHDLYLDLMAIVGDEAQFRHAEFLWIIPEAVRHELMARFEEMPEEAVRAVVRKGIEEVFELDDKDIVLFLRNRIYIRDYLPPKPVPEGTERRFAGEDPEEMEALFVQCFPEGIEEEIEEYLPEVLDESLNFTVIDNQTFNKTYILVFRSMIEIILLEMIEGFPEEKIEGFTGFVLRKYFDEILVYTARELLYYVEERDKNAEKFIKYYRDEVVIDPVDGRKIQKYAIIDAKNQTWNYSAILSILMQFTQAKKRVEQQIKKIESIKVRLGEIEGELSNEKQECRKFEDDAHTLNELVSLKKAHIDRNSLSADAIVQAQLNKEYAELLDRQKEARNRVTFADRRFKNKKTELENWKKQLASNENTLDEIRQQNDTIVEMIELVVDAIALVFAKR